MCNIVGPCDPSKVDHLACPKWQSALLTGLSQYADAVYNVTYHILQQEEYAPSVSAKPPIDPVVHLQ